MSSSPASTWFSQKTGSPSHFCLRTLFRDVIFLDTPLFLAAFEVGRFFVVPKALLQPSAYFCVVPIRVIVTVNYLTSETRVKKQTPHHRTPPVSRCTDRVVRNEPHCLVDPQEQVKGSPPLQTGTAATSVTCATACFVGAVMRPCYNVSFLYRKRCG